MGSERPLSDEQIRALRSVGEYGPVMALSAFNYLLGRKLIEVRLTDDGRAALERESDRRG